MAVLGIMPASGQTVNQLSPEVRQFVSVAEPVVALTRVRVIDGTGGPIANNQIVVTPPARYSRGPLYGCCTALVGVDR